MKKLYTFLILGLAPIALFAQLLTPQVDSIPMRDNKKLAADIHIPSGCNQCPTVLIQTPYNRMFYRVGLPLGIGQNVDSSAYNFVIVDWRGFYGSSGALNGVPNRGEDGYDVVEWIASQPWSDGQIATWGPSALGKIQFQTARENPPHLACICPLVAGPQFNYSEYYPGGVLRTEYVEQLDALGFGLSTTLLANQVHNVTWQFIENQNYYPSEIQVPTFMIGGWYDHNVEVMLEMFSGLQSQSPQNVRDKHKLMMGPWAHGGFGQAQVGACMQGELTYTEACGWSDSLARDFLDFYLQGSQNGWDINQSVMYFQMGENNWYQDNAWPVQTASPVKFYLDGNNGLTTTIPSTSGSSSTLVYDPRDPSPTIGGATLQQGLFQGPADQAFMVESRNDVLIFTSAPLFSDAIMKGPARIKLFVSSDRTDTDFVVRMTDVYPDGRSMLLAENIQRMRFRNGFTANDTSLIVPNSVYEINFELPDLANTFIAGHKVRIDITSSNYPRFDSNLNNGMAMYAAGDTLVATNTVYHEAIYPSHIELPLENYTSISEVQDMGSFALYPNPANDIVKVALSSTNTVELEILDVTGRRVHSHTITNTQSVDISTSELLAGTYFVRLRQQDKVSTQKLVVLK